jgi:ribonuclease-3
VAKRTQQPVDVEERLAIAEAATGHRFTDRALLKQALSHPSVTDDRDPSCYYERLEFLGDSVLGMIVSEEVYRRFPDVHEGVLTRVKAAVVFGANLSEAGKRLGLDKALFLGAGEIGAGERGLPSALENSFEALVAALYLDAGMDYTREWVLATLGDSIREDAAPAGNPKGALQELLQDQGLAPVYAIVSQIGPPHDRVFNATVSAESRLLGEGSGRSKKEAEVAAAAAALEALSDGGS